MADTVVVLHQQGYCQQETFHQAAFSQFDVHKVSDKSE